MTEYHALTDVPGLLVGHYTDRAAATGCTAILCPAGAVAGVDVRGGAPGTRELDLLHPTCLVDRIHGLMLAGGSAFGLAAADGAMRWLEEQGIGFDVGVARVPIVPAAILFDLNVGRADVRPDAAAGYAACAAAVSGPVAEGSVGAGTGAAVGKILGPSRATEGGIGTASRRLENGIIVAALAAVNAYGDVVDPTTGQILAGARAEDGRTFVDAMAVAAQRAGAAHQVTWTQRHGGNTTLGVVATNAPLDKMGATRLAIMAQDGLARTIRPVHTLVDGDIVFGLATGDPTLNTPGDASLLGALAADVLATAVVRAVALTEGLHGLPARRDLIG
jgi:L-aminopeptidase/D-esterase-like protein